MLDDDRYLAHLCGLAANPNLPRQLLDRLVTAASGELHDQSGTAGLLDHPGAFELLNHSGAADPLEPGTGTPLLDAIYPDPARLGELQGRPAVFDLLDHPDTVGSYEPPVLDHPGPSSHPGPGEVRSRTSTIAPGVRRGRPSVAGPRDLAEFLAMTDRSPMLPPRLPSEPVAEPQESVRKNGLHIQATKNPDCTPELLHHIAQTANPDSVVHTEVAKHPNTTAETLLLCLAKPAARRHAARHPNLPPQIITDLLDDPDLLVAEAAAANPALPPKVMKALLA